MDAKHRAPQAGAGPKPLSCFFGCKLWEEKKEYHCKSAERCKEQIILRTMCLDPIAKEEVHTVELEMPKSKRNCTPVTLASLRPNALNTVNLGGCELTPPVTFRLTSGSGPVYISGQHLIVQNDCRSEEENNSSPIKRPFKYETSEKSVHQIKKKLKLLQYDDVSETDYDDDDDGSDICEVPMLPPEIIDLTGLDGEESNSGLPKSDDESSPADIIQKVINWNRNRKCLEGMRKKCLQNMRRDVDLNQDNPFLPDHLKDGKCIEGAMGKKVVWVLGHSFIRRAAYRLKQIHKQKPAALRNVSFRWCGVGDLKINQLRDLVMCARDHGGLQSPDLIILHLGGNDLTTLGRRELRETILSEFAWLGRAFPEARLAWSHIIRRKTWGAGINSRALNVSVRRLNSDMAKLCGTTGRLGHIPHKLLRGEAMFHKDGIHLSDAGTDLFTDTIWAFAISQLVESGEDDKPVVPGLPGGGIGHTNC